MRRQYGDSVEPASRPGALRQERRPRRIGGKARRRNSLLVAAGNVDRIERWAGIAAGIAEKHDNSPIWRKCRTFVVEPFGEDAFAGSIRLHHPDREFILAKPRERDVVAARRPNRCGVAAIAEADALRRAAAGVHQINLL